MGMSCLRCGAYRLWHKCGDLACPMKYPAASNESPAEKQPPPSALASELDQKQPKP